MPASLAAPDEIPAPSRLTWWSDAGILTPKEFLEKNVDIIMGLGFPLSKTGDPKDKKLANEIIHGGLMAELFTGELLVYFMFAQHAFAFYGMQGYTEFFGFMVLLGRH